MGTIDVIHVIIILGVHYFADFICQTREMATNKSSSLYWLSAHVFTYTSITTIIWFLCFILIKEPPIHGKIIVQIFLTTFITHWVTDFITSILSSEAYKDNKIYKFFNIVGFDQFIHGTTLLLTYGIFI